MTDRDVRLLSVATATPVHVIDQDEAAARTVALLGGKVFRNQDIVSLFANTGIRTRRAVRPMAWYVRSRIRGRSVTPSIVDRSRSSCGSRSRVPWR